MQTWQEFITGMDHDDFRAMIRDYEQFQADGVIGECVLRSKAQEWHGNLNLSGSNIVLTMQHLATESYKYFAHKYMDGEGVLTW